VKVLKYENDKLNGDISDLKVQLMSGSFYQTQAPSDSLKKSFCETQHALELEQENFRKKVKRLTGELDSLETYFQSLQVLFVGNKQSPQNIPQAVVGPANKLFRNL